MTRVVVGFACLKNGFSLLHSLFISIPLIRRIGTSDFISRFFQFPGFFSKTFPNLLSPAKREISACSCFLHFTPTFFPNLEHRFSRGMLSKHFQHMCFFLLLNLHPPEFSPVLCLALCP